MPNSMAQLYMTWIMDAKCEVLTVVTTEADIFQKYRCHPKILGAKILIKTTAILRCHRTNSSHHSDQVSGICAPLVVTTQISCNGAFYCCLYQSVTNDHLHTIQSFMKNVHYNIIYKVSIWKQNSTLNRFTGDSMPHIWYFYHSSYT